MTSVTKTAQQPVSYSFTGVPEGVTEPAWLEVDLDALAFNVRAVRRHIGPGVKFMAVVKGDAMGLGAGPCAAAALANGADCLGVVRAAEAVRLRRCGITAPILNLGFATPGELPLLSAHDVAQTYVRATRSRDQRLA